MKLSSTLCLILCCASARANTLLVPSQYPTIQQALDAAGPGDSVLVADGTYTENLVWPQINDLHLLADPANVGRPIIDGASAGRVIDIEASGSGARTAEVSGFVITHGFLDVPAHTGQTGAGIFASETALRVSKCVIRDNKITSTFAIQNSGGGAGLSIVSTPAGLVNKISGCRFLSNVVNSVTNGDGPAIHLDTAPTIIKSTEIENNTITVDEVALGMIYDFASNLTLQSVIISNNQAETTQSLLAGFAAIKGTAVFSYLSNVEIVDGLITGNISRPQNSTLTLLGAGIYFYGEGSTLLISSSTIASNKRDGSAAVAGTALFFSSANVRTATVVNSILWNPGNGDEIDSFSKPVAAFFSDVRGGGVQGTGNIDADPLFASETDFHLQLTSPCINAGDNKFAPSADLDGNVRPLPVGTHVDVGSYEMDQ
jgi:hypothetical protein